MKLPYILSIICACLMLGACSGAKQQSRLRIGFAMDTLKEERWQRDHDAFEAACKKADVDCVITVADNKADKQANDVDNLLTQGIDVLVIAPHNATQAASMVDKAKAQGVPVISYDRLINSDKIDVYISHQVPVLGRKIAEYAIQHVPKGNYVVVDGASSDNNAVIMKNEYQKVLRPAIDKGDIKIVAEDFMEDWKPELALNFADNALTQNNDNVQAFVVSNDGMAGGVVAALTAQGLAGQVPVSGQDGDKAALNRVALGSQTVSVWKDSRLLGRSAGEAALELGKGIKLDKVKGVVKFGNGPKKVEMTSILLNPEPITKDNLKVVIDAGWITKDEVCKGVKPGTVKACG